MPVTAPHYLTSGRLAVEVHADRPTLGRAAARAVAAHLHGVIARQGEARVIFACAPSQDQFLAALIDPAQCGLALDWSRITAFHMDDYVGLTAAHPQSFRHYLQQHLLRHVPIARFHPLPAEQPDATTVAAHVSASAFTSSTFAATGAATAFASAKAAKAATLSPKPRCRVHEHVHLHLLWLLQWLPERLLLLKPEQRHLRRWRPWGAVLVLRSRHRL